ncbi:MAG: isopenicillin N synthase family dioxygenase [Silvanigrellaceae bacterium]
MRFTKPQKVQTLDIRSFTTGNAKDQAQFVKQFGTGLQEYGFVIIEGHGIAPSLIQDCYGKAKSFFDLPVETKKQYAVANGGGQRGYTGMFQEHAKDSKQPDIKEFWHIGRETFTHKENQNRYPGNVWPDAHVAGFRPAFTQLYSQLEDMASTLLQATSLHLDLPRNTLSDMIVDGNSIIRALHYPPLAPEHFKSGAVRAAAHEDINFITILCEATESGLELLTHDGKWLSVESGPGQMVVDSGDMLSRICNDVIPSTTHRVVNPPGAKNVTRYSMPFFVHPHSRCPLEVLSTCASAQNPAKYSPILADEFLHQRLREIGLVKA